MQCIFIEVINLNGSTIFIAKCKNGKLLRRCQLCDLQDDRVCSARYLRLKSLGRWHRIVSPFVHSCKWSCREWTADECPQLGRHPGLALSVRNISTHSFLKLFYRRFTQLRPYELLPVHTSTTPPSSRYICCCRGGQNRFVRRMILWSIPRARHSEVGDCMGSAILAGKLIVIRGSHSVVYTRHEHWTDDPSLTLHYFVALVED